MADRGITVTRAAQSRVFVPNRGEGFRLLITASDAIGMPVEVFGHRRRLIDPYSGDTGDEFCFVCSPFDLSIYPANEPDPTQFPQFFRKAVVDIVLASQTALEEAWTAIRGEVCGLVEALNKFERLIPAETVRCGDPAPTDDSSVSDSISSSV